MVKHVSSYVYIPLQITDWEIEIEKNYTNRIDELVEFRLTQTENIYKLIAVLVDATYTPEFHLLTQLHNHKEIIQAALVGKNEDGYFATLLDGKVDAFILIPKELTEAQRNLLSNLKKGDSLPVTIKQIYNNKKASLVLAS
jgi:ribosomal protein S1